MRACSAGTLTVASTPGRRLSTFSIRTPQAAQVMPLIGSSSVLSLSTGKFEAGADDMKSRMDREPCGVKAAFFGPDFVTSTRNDTYGSLQVFACKPVKLA
jgi:hypothetical protein